MKNHIKALIIGVLVSFVVLINFYNITEKDLVIEEDKERTFAIERVSLYTERIESILITGDNYTDFFKFFDSQNDASPEEDFQNFAHRIMSTEDGIYNLILTEGSVIKSIYPYEGNEATIGYDLMKDEKIKPIVLETIYEGGSVIQGPIKALQGGLKVFNQKPIFIIEDGREKVWGTIVVGIGFYEMIDKIDLKAFNEGYFFALKSEKADGVEDYIWGREEIFNKSPVIKEIKIPGQKWQIAIYPRNGWTSEQGILKAMPIYNYCIAFLVMVIVYQFISSYYTKSKEAETDDLTGIMNKRAFIYSTEKNYKYDSKIGHALLIMDVNDFKIINDTHGHMIGDLVLIEVTKRVKQFIRSSDCFCRIGGDEFFILIQDTEGDKELNGFIRRLKKEFKKPMIICDQSIKVSISVGGAVYPTDGTTHSELYRIADKRMYEDKRILKNKQIIKRSV